MTPVGLTVAGSDSSGGAGIQADVRTFHALGVHGATAITAVTAQGSRGVTGFTPVGPDLVRAQIRATLDDLRPAAVKTGMLATAEVVDVVASELATIDVPLVCDPVLVSTSGRRLLSESGQAALVERLFPRVALLTPNAVEAAALGGGGVGSAEEAEAAGRRLLALGPAAVLVKGGHFGEAEAVDVLVTPSGVRHFAGARVDTPHTHGTGCVLSAAIAAWLARGLELPEAVARGKRFVTAALRRGEPWGDAPGAVRPPRGETE